MYECCTYYDIYSIIYIILYVLRNDMIGIVAHSIAYLTIYAASWQHNRHTRKKVLVFCTHFVQIFIYKIQTEYLALFIPHINVCNKNIFHANMGNVCICIIYICVYLFGQ